MFEISPIEPNFWSLVKTAPEALMNSLFRPYPWDVNSFFTLIASLENLVVIVVLILGAVYFKPIPGNRTNLSLLFFTSGLILLLIVGWTTPVAGALVRYKIPGVIAVLMGVCLTADFNRMKLGFWVKRALQK